MCVLPGGRPTAQQLVESPMVQAVVEKLRIEVSMLFIQSYPLISDPGKIWSRLIFRVFSKFDLEDDKCGRTLRKPTTGQSRSHIG